MLKSMRNSSGLVKVCVENLGPIERGCVELPKLVILTGLQNSGKSYLATLIYFIRREIYSRVLNNIVSTLNRAESEALFTLVINTSRVEEKIRRVIEENVDKVVAETKQELKTIVKAMLPKYFAHRDVRDIVSRGESEAVIEAEVNIGEESLRTRIIVKREAEPDIEINSDDVSRVLKKTTSITRFSVEESSVTLRLLADSERRETLYIPSERIVLVPSYYASISLLASLFRAPSIHFAEKNFAIKTPVLDYIDAISASLSREVNGVIFDKKIGGFTVENGKVFYIDKRGEKYPIESTSSGISQLIGIVMPVNHIGVDKLKLIVIEEPEINLHPDLHLKVAEYIARLSRKTHIVVTTHSEYFLGKINNLIQKGKLRASDVKTYLIHNKRVKELRITKQNQ